MSSGVNRYDDDWDRKDEQGRPLMPCDTKCNALVEPVTLEEYKAALEHCENHSLLSGCSHAQ